MTLLALNVEEGARNQGMQEAYRSWKKQGDILALSLQRGTQPCWHLDFSPVRPWLTSDDTTAR